jgi:hypothetical protein
MNVLVKILKVNFYSSKEIVKIMKSVFNRCLIITIVTLLLSIAILQINFYLDTYYKGIGAIIDIGAYYSLIISSYVLLILLGYKIFTLIRTKLKK